MLKNITNSPRNHVSFLWHQFQSPKTTFFWNAWQSSGIPDTFSSTSQKCGTLKKKTEVQKREAPNSQKVSRKTKPPVNFQKRTLSKKRQTHKWKTLLWQFKSFSFSLGHTSRKILLVVTALSFRFLHYTHTFTADHLLSELWQFIMNELYFHMKLALIKMFSH